MSGEGQEGFKRDKPSLERLGECVGVSQCIPVLYHEVHVSILVIRWVGWTFQKYPISAPFVGTRLFDESRL